MAQPSLDKDKNQVPRQCMRKSQTPPKSELRQAQKHAFTTLPHGSETSSSKPLKEKDKAAQWLDKKRGATQPGQRQKSIKFLGNACEKAKHHLNPSSDKPKNDAFATLPHGSETSSSKPLKEKDKAAQSLDKKRGATQHGQRQKSSSSAMHAKKPNTT